MNAADKMTAKMQNLSVDQLRQVTFAMLLDTSEEATVVFSFATTELQERLSDAEFCALMDECDAMLDVAA